MYVLSAVEAKGIISAQHHQAMKPTKAMFLNQNAQCTPTQKHHENTRKFGKCLAYAATLLCIALSTRQMSKTIKHVWFLFQK